MKIGFFSVYLVFLIKTGELRLVKRQSSSISDVCISTKADEYSIVGSFYKQFNQNNKFTDTSFNVLNKLDLSVWSQLRASQQFRIDPSTGLMVPTGFYSSGATSFPFSIKNDQNFTYQSYWITGGGVPSLYVIVKPGATWKLGGYFGHCWYLKNLNTSQVLAFKLGEAPFLTSNITCNMSQITKTNYDYIKTPYMFYVNGSNGSNGLNGSNASNLPFVPSGVVSATNGSEFSFTLNNNLNDSYSVYWIDTNGNAVFYSTLIPGATYTQSSSFGYIWFLQNNNPFQKETLYIKLGELPFDKSGVTVNLSDILSTVEDIVLENSLQRYSSRQTYIGNCYMLQCFISMYARYPEKVVSRFIYPSKFKSTGAVVLKLWNDKKGCWTPFVVDDYLPRYGSGSWFYGTSSSDFNEFWTSLLEKTFAKRIGDFPGLVSGTSNISVNDVYRTALGPVKYSYFIVPYPDPSLSGFNKLLSYYKNGTVVSITSRDCNVSTTGLVCYHGYGLLDIREKVVGTNFTFIKAQNTWSQAGEWNGDWSDSSSLWDQYPDVKVALNYENKNDGAFWIEKADFAKAFKVLWAAQIK